MDKVILYCGSFSALSGILLALSYFIFGLDAKAIVVLCALAFCGNVFQYTATYICAYKDIHRDWRSISNIRIYTDSYNYYFIITCF